MSTMLMTSVQAHVGVSMAGATRHVSAFRRRRLRDKETKATCGICMDFLRNSVLTNTAHRSDDALQEERKYTQVLRACVHVWRGLKHRVCSIR